MTSAQGAAFAVSMLLVLAANGLLGAIFRYERREHVDAWLADGRPGLSWLVGAPRESWTGRWRILGWAVATRTWARGDATAARLFLAWRTSLVACLAAFVVLFALVAR